MGKVKEALFDSDHQNIGEHEHYHEYMSRRLAEVDLDPAKRTWEYDGQGMRRDKQTGLQTQDFVDCVDRIEKKLDFLMKKMYVDEK